MKNTFDLNDANSYIQRINTLAQNTNPKWGKMSVSQMLAHCNVTYDLVYHPEKFKKPNPLMKFLMKTFAKKIVTGDKPFKQNSPTGPMFIIKNEPNFEDEKKRLIGYIQKTQQLGTNAFEGKENFNFGKLTAKEWNSMFAKHLDHHLEQFGV